MQNMKSDLIILELMETCTEAIVYVKNTFENGNLEDGMNMLKDINLLIERIEVALNLNGNIECLKNSILYCKNIRYSIEKVTLNIRQNLLESAKLVLAFEILPFVYELKLQLDFELTVLPFEEKWNLYRNEREKKIRDYASNLNNHIDNYKYRASIVLIAYNKFEYTKKAVESIFRFTDFQSGKYELITINNGCDDETEEYFNSLPHKKKINLKYNILGTQVAKYITDGKYGVHFSNDAIATVNWIEQLIICMESDNRIIWAVPTCNEDAISNLQGVKIPYKNSLDSLEEINLFSQSYNKSNCNLWEEKIILMPFVAIQRNQYVLDCGSGIDRLYKQGEFVDDDKSTSFRRAGLKQILAKDTFMHHFGSVTLGDGKRNQNSLGNMREVYYQKWGVDAWDSRCYFPGIETLLEPSLLEQNPRLLFIEPRFGGGSLQIKNCLRKHGIFPRQTVGMVVDQRYIEDAIHMYDETIGGNDIYQMLDKEKRQFDIIAIGCPLHDIVSKDVIGFLEMLYEKLVVQGKIIFLVKNYRSAKVIVDLLQNNMPGDCGFKNIEFTGIHCGKLIETIKNHEFLHCYNVLRVEKQTPEVEAILNMDDAYHTLEETEKRAIREEFGTLYYMIMIEKVLS